MKLDGKGWTALAAQAAAPKSPSLHATKEWTEGIDPTLDPAKASMPGPLSDGPLATRGCSPRIKPTDNESVIAKMCLMPLCRGLSGSVWVYGGLANQRLRQASLNEACGPDKMKRTLAWLEVCARKDTAVLN